MKFDGNKAEEQVDLWRFSLVQNPQHIQPPRAENHPTRFTSQ
jgi:hypothetical protein